MNKYPQKFPELYQFFGGYFYQGWATDYRWEGNSPNFNAVVRHFKAVNPPATVMNVRTELEELLAIELSEEELSQALKHLGSNFYPTGQNLTFHQWITQILEILNESQSMARVLRELQ